MRPTREQLDRVTDADIAVADGWASAVVAQITASYTDPAQRLAAYGALARAAGMAGRDLVDRFAVAALAAGPAPGVEREVARVSQLPVDAVSDRFVIAHAAKGEPV